MAKSCFSDIRVWIRKKKKKEEETREKKDMKENEKEITVRWAFLIMLLLMSRREIKDTLLQLLRQ